MGTTMNDALSMAVKEIIPAKSHSIKSDVNVNNTFESLFTIDHITALENDYAKNKIAQSATKSAEYENLEPYQKMLLFYAQKRAEQSFLSAKRADWKDTINKAFQAYKRPAITDKMDAYYTEMLNAISDDWAGVDNSTKDSILKDAAKGLFDLTIKNLAVDTVCSKLGVKTISKR